MLVSILHRATGSALAGAAVVVLTWWLAAIAAGPAAFSLFQTAATHPLGTLVLIGLTWAFLHHLAGGLRHLWMDTGAGYDLKINRQVSIATMIASASLTVVIWAYLLLMKGA
jgi:succinate dehydrogenase / fumarate reductase, cytochrome b subunit